MSSERTHLLVLCLDGPLQSWGHQSRFDHRTTLSYPTKSGIVGLIGAAMGVDRDESEKIRELAELKMTVYVLKPGVRMVDFHTVGGGYDTVTERMWMARKADGKKPATVVTHRHYLQDARFGVILEGESALLDRCREALENPRWGVWLGRKSCIPAAPVFRGIFDDREAAEAHLEDLALQMKSTIGRCVEEAAVFEEGSEPLTDVPVNFQDREFGVRWVSVESYPPPEEGG